MLDFHDVPSGPAVPGIGSPPVQVPLPAAGLGVGEPSLAYAECQISATWDIWFAGLKGLAAPVPIGVDINDVAAAMAADVLGTLPVGDCFTYCCLYLTEAGFPPRIAAKGWMGDLPAHHRRATDELLGIALSLATAANQGYQFFASRCDVNMALPPGMQIWTKPWDGDGPDYILDNGIGGIAFLEIKARATDCKRKPVSFAKYKAQSINANVMGLQNRYLLSYAYLPANGALAGGASVPANVQWFNVTSSQRTNSQAELVQLRHFVSLVIAFCQFKTQLRNAGHDYLTILSRNPVANELGFVVGNGYWVEHRPAGVRRLVIADQARSCFRRIAELMEQLHAVDSMDALKDRKLGNLLGRLTSLRGSVRRRLDAALDGSIAMDFSSFVDELTLNTSSNISRRNLIAYELYASSRFELSSRARFLLLVMAIESLVIQAKRAEDEQELISHLLEIVGASTLDEIRRTALMNGLQTFRKVSIGESCRSLISEAVKAGVVEDTDAANHFRNCYRIRGKIVHSGKTPSPSALSDESNRLEKTVRQLISWALQHAIPEPDELWSSEFAQFMSPS